LKIEFEKYIADNQLFIQNDKLLVAVSGGVDSVVLCQLLSICGYNFSIVHCNFQLRGAESDGDESFVKELSEKLQVPFYSQKMNTPQYVADHKVSTQLAAREMRYRWFEELRQSLNYTYILTAHHASDNIETVLYNFAKGTGLLGLTGIKPKNEAIIRPLLWAKKEGILAFAKAENLSFREDSSNESDKYARNFIRHNIIPEFKNINPSFETTAIENIKRLNETRELFDFFIQKIKIEITESIDNQLFINKIKLQTYPSVSTVLFELLKEFGFNAAQIAQILKENEDKIGTIYHSTTHRLLIDRDHYIVAQNAENEEAVDSFTIFKDDVLLKNSQFELLFDYLVTYQEPFSKNPNQILLDADKLKFPLTLRKVREGDRFQPLGMAGKSQLLSDFFRLKKLSIFEKEKVWILETAAKEICWVVGFRIDERYKMTDLSKNQVQMTFIYNKFVK
jgi:tRNA(Ile)-lysidine synthase